MRQVQHFRAADDIVGQVKPATLSQHQRVCPLAPRDRFTDGRIRPMEEIAGAVRLPCTAWRYERQQNTVLTPLLTKVHQQRIGLTCLQLHLPPCILQRMDAAVIDREVVETPPLNQRINRLGRIADPEQG